MVEISDKAVEEFKNVLEVMGKPNFNIKFIKMVSSCCGLSYKILFVDKEEENDLEIEKTV